MEMRDQNSEETVAIISMAGRFPGANDLNTFWNNIKNSQESISHFSDKQLRRARIDNELINNPNYAKAKGVIEDIELFDAHFFAYSPHEASIMDPQQRLFLELCWQALEKAGYCAEKYDGQIGVFAGTGTSTYLYNNLLGNKDYVNAFNSDEIIIANDSAYLSTRISYKLNLTGPSLNINTACSTSLVAIATAYKQLVNYDCDMALAGGVAIFLPQIAGYFYQEGGIPSKDGHCRAFDATASGTALSGGAGVVLLKRWEDAVKDGDHIEAVIIGAAINNDGSDKVGFTAPSVFGQAHCITEAIRSSEINPETIELIEAHGTGTSLGDLIEIAALAKVFSAKTYVKQFCAIGSVKTNIGHASEAAGVAGLIKVVYALKDKVLPPSLNFNKPNPNIDFEKTAFYVNTKLQPWKKHKDHPRRAGVSSFGIGGTNAHVIIEEVEAKKQSNNSRPIQMLMLSAKTSTALDKATTNLREALPHNNLADIAFTLQVGRKDFNHRRAIICKDTKEELAELSYEYKPENRPNLVFMFSGQGNQYPNMGLGLYKTEPVFTESVNECCDILLSYLGIDFRNLLYPKPEKEKYAAEQLKKTQFTQPVLFIIEYALAKLFMSWGIKPSAVMGHSIGEYMAGYIAGVFSLHDALILSANRGKLIGQLETGTMLAVALPENEVVPLLGKDVFLSAVNSPKWCVISGTHNAVQKFTKKIKSTYASKIRLVALHTSHAFHSAMMEPMLKKFSVLFKNIDRNSAQIPFFSTVTGKEISPDELKNPDYWVNHIRDTVRFSGAIQKVFTKKYNILLELGPGNTLASLAKSHPHDANVAILSSLPSEKIFTRDDKKTSKLTHEALANLWLRGIDIDWHGFYKHEKRRRVPLPTYPFERQRYWIEPSAAKTKTQKAFTLIKTENSAYEHKTKPTEHSVITTLKDVFKEVLGLQNLSINDNFFDLGGHSLLALRLIARIEESFDLRMPLSIIYQSKTVAALAKLIIAPEIFRQPLSPLVTLQAKGRKNPLFFIHPIGGTVFCYLPLAKNLGKDRPFYAIQDPRINDNSLSFSNLQEVASMYICRIKKIKPHGPYLLGGHSYGGIVAFEIARQLKENQEEVQFVASLDSWAAFSNAFRDKALFEEMMQRQHETLHSQLATNIPIPDQKVWLDLQWNRMQSLYDYKPPKTNIKLTLFKAKELLPENKDIDDEHNHWQKYTNADIDSHIVPGDHDTMLVEPHIGFLAKKLQILLNKFN
jgi:acyl transferase domain-containing protein/thioesterase domain-containing protein